MLNFKEITKRFLHLWLNFWGNFCKIVLNIVLRNSGGIASAISWQFSVKNSNNPQVWIFDRFFERSVRGKLRGNFWTLKGFWNLTWTSRVSSDISLGTADSSYEVLPGIFPRLSYTISRFFFWYFSKNFLEFISKFLLEIVAVFLVFILAFPISFFWSSCRIFSWSFLRIPSKITYEIFR